MRWLVAMGVVVLAGVGVAEPRKLVVAAGDCHDPALVTGIGELQRALRELPGAQVYEPEVVLDIIRPRSSRSVEDIKRQVDSARTLFYGSQPDRALELIRQALAELERVSPEAKPWAVTAEALTLQALFHKSAGRKPEATESLRRVLRLDPQHALDPDQFTPSMIQACDAVRKELARAKKVVLQVQANAGAEVSLDGKPVGRAPLKLEVLPGSYRLALVAPESESFARTIDVRRDELVQVDMAFEGSVSARAPLCISATGDQAQQDAAAKLAVTVNAEELVLLRVESPRGAAAVFHGSLSKGAPLSRVRDGLAKAGQLGELARFLVAGAPLPAPGLKASTRANEPPVAKADLPPTSDTPKVDAALAPVAAEPPLPPAVQASATSGARVTSYALMAGGGAAVAAGAVVYALGAPLRARFAELHTEDGRFYPPADPRHREALDLMGKVDANSTASFGLVGVGLGAAAAGVAAFLLFPPGAPVSVGAAPSSDGAVVTVQGRF